ncbi:protein ABHD11-like isoform X2 [Portunus trituberculatus]|uniref:protein ABHD11-like isoform X1 n=2 Tax=Portunus trituberculatus TaxID=210409 RepID=UPI001E1CF57B|nr:protein ABHD11-like isoform X1 [Portunus trituberculatus]XP_045125135.1 protein ABHD11-like isoform X2 [Portunus trituberculatus]
MQLLRRTNILRWGKLSIHKGLRDDLRRQISSSVVRCAGVPMSYTLHSPPDSTSSQPPLIIMHGLMGSKTNWKSLGKAIASRMGMEVFTVDARNHGDSPHTDDHSYPLLAEDILLFMQQHSIPTATLMGHSMGGRAVMATALMEPSVVDRLVVLDMSPVGTSKSISSLPRFLEIMLRIAVPPDLSPPQAKTHVDNLLKPAIPEAGIRQFLLTNLTQAPEGGYTWRVNVKGIAKNFNPHISTFPAASLPHHSFEGETFFIAGALSDYLRPKDEEAVEEIFPQASFHYLEGAGHWLHADQPAAFLNLLSLVLLP